MVSDLVLRKELPAAVKKSVEAYVGCLAGAVLKADYLKYIKKAGFRNIKITGETPYPIEAMTNDAAARAVKVVSINVLAEKAK
jgi:tRNA G26 N,N-dimethylase Trm1